MKESLFINGYWKQGEGETFSSLCPVTQKVLWEGKEPSKSQVILTMKAAQQAFTAWSQLNLAQRISYLNRYKQLLERDSESLALLISKEVGKPLWESKTEIVGVIAKIQTSIDAYHERTGEHHQDSTRLTHKPHGVFVILGPYNFPAHLPNGHIVPALLAGNTVIFKPSELTPLVADAMIKLFDEAQFPKGSINLIQGRGNIGKLLLNAHPAGVLFTGSYATGKKIHAHFAGQVDVVLALEMGGNNPLIVREVENVDSALYLSVLSSFISSGQRCTCARRLLIPSTSWGDAFIERLVKLTKALKVGEYKTVPEPFMGPLISMEASTHLMKKQSEWLALGAVNLLSMQQGEGALLSPGLIDVTSIRQHIKDEEIFGPLLQIIRYSEFDEAISIANETKYGLSSGLISDCKKEQESFYKLAKAGIVNINKPLTGASGKLPFGGVGHSGNHRPSAYYSADFCAYPVATVEAKKIEPLPSLPPGLSL